MSRRSPAATRARPYAVTGGNPFYVTELLASRTARRPAALGRARRARARVAARRRRSAPGGARLGRARTVSNTSVLDAVMPDWAGCGRGAGAPAAARGRAGATSASATSWHGTRSGRASRSPARRRLHAEILDGAARCGRRPGRHRPPRRGGRRRGRRRRLRARRRPTGGRAGVEPGGVLPLPARRRTSSTGSPPREQAAVLEELATRGVRRLPARGRVPGDRARDRRLRTRSATGRPSAAARGSCRGSTGTPATATPRGQGARGDRRSSSRSASRSSSHGPTAGSRSSRTSRRTTEQALEWGERALELAIRLGDESTRAHVLVNIGSIRLDVDHRQTSPLLEAHAVADAVGEPARGDPCARQPRLRAHVLGAAGAGAPLRGARRSRTREENEVHNLASYVATTLAWLRLRAGDWDEAERITRREIEKSITVAQLVAKTVLAELAVRRGDRGCGRAAGRRSRLRRFARASRSGSSPVARARDRVGADAGHADADRAVRQAARGDPRRSGDAAPAGARSASPRGRPSPGSTSSSTEPRSGPVRGDAPAGLGGSGRRLRRRRAGPTTGR